MSLNRSVAIILSTDGYKKSRSLNSFHFEFIRLYQATLSMLILLVLNFRCAYSSVTWKIFTF